MFPSNFRQANLLLKGPEGSDIVPLPIFANQSENTLTSLWMPTDKEREIIAAGGGVTVSVLGSAHPPILVGAAVIEMGEHFGAQDAPQAS